MAECFQVRKIKGTEPCSFSRSIFLILQFRQIRRFFWPNRWHWSSDFVDEWQKIQIFKKFRIEFWIVSNVYRHQIHSPNSASRPSLPAYGGVLSSVITHLCYWVSEGKSQQFATLRGRPPVVFYDLSFYVHSFGRFEYFYGQTADIDLATWSNNIKIKF